MQRYLCIGEVITKEEAAISFFHFTDEIYCMFNVKAFKFFTATATDVVIVPVLYCGKNLHC